MILSENQTTINCLLFFTAKSGVYLFFLCFQQAAYNPEVSEEVKKRALTLGAECTAGYIDLLEQVLLVG